MANKEAIDDFVNMFDVENKNIEKEEEKESQESFSSLVDELSEDISLLDKKKSKTSKKIPQKEEIVEEKEVLNNNEKKEIKFVNGEIQWLLKSPTKLYDKFYQRKKELIEEFTKGGHLPFERWTVELLDCNVNTQSEVFDNKIYVRQMGQIQQYMERVKNIQIKCNNQYFIWKRFIDGLKGTLARTEYLKPALKQDGLVLEHMRDVEWYYGSLQSMHESAKSVMETLERAFEMLSRKATITTPIKSGDKYYKPLDRTSQELLSGYDELPEKAEVKNKVEKNNFLDWEEIG